MIRFQSQYLRECINDGNDNVMMEYCSLCLYELKRVSKREESEIGQKLQPWFILRTISQLSSLFKNKTESPILKFKATKLLAYLLLINNPQVHHKFQLELYPLIKNICLYNKSLPIQNRGLDYFKNNKYYQTANGEQKQKIKQIGVKFISYCLELTLTMNKWWRIDQMNRTQVTLYGKGYDALLKQGVKFMEDQEMIFWSQVKVAQIIKNINKCTKMINENIFNIKSTGLYKHNLNNVSNLSNTSVSVSYTQNPSRLNKQVEQKDDLINSLKIEVERLKGEKEGLIREFTKQKQEWEHRVIECEKRLRVMKGVAKVLKDKLRSHQGINENQISEFDGSQYQLQNILFQSLDSQPSQLQNMRQSIKLLILQNLKLDKQNSQLKITIQHLEGKVQKQFQMHKNKNNRENKVLKYQLLKNQCKQKTQTLKISQENNPNLKKLTFNQLQHASYKSLNKYKRDLIGQNQSLFVKDQSQNQKDFDQTKSVDKINVNFKTDYKNINESSLPNPFSSPFYTCLNSQLRVRLKRCLLKHKQVLYKDQNIEIGVQHTIKDDISFKLKLVVTNLTNCHQTETTINSLMIQITNKNPPHQLNIQEVKRDHIHQNCNHEKQQKTYKNTQENGQISFYKQTLPLNNQWKIQLIISVNEINFIQPILMTTNYKVTFNTKNNKKIIKNKQFQKIIEKNSSQKIKQLENSKIPPQKQNQQQKTIALILPVSKIKLLHPITLKKTPISHKNLSNITKTDVSTITKLIKPNFKVFSSFGKLLTYFGYDNFQTFNNINADKLSKQIILDNVSPEIYKQSQQFKQIQQSEEITLNFTFFTTSMTITFRQIKQKYQQQQNYSPTPKVKDINQKNPIKIINSSLQNTLIMIKLTSFGQFNHNILQSIADQLVFFLSKN